MRLVGAEVARTERLQWMARFPATVGAGESPLQVRRQFAQDDRSGNRLVLLEVAPGVGQDQAAPRGEDGLEKGEAVVVAHIPVAHGVGIRAEQVFDELERHRRRPAGERPVVHAHGADHLRRQDLAGREAGDGDAVGQAGNAPDRFVGMLGQHVAQHGKAHRRDRARLFALAGECVDQAGHRADLAADFGVEATLRGEEPGEDFRAQPLAPLLRCSFGLSPVVEREGEFAVAVESSEQFVVVAAGVPPRIKSTRRDVVVQNVVAVDGVAEKQAAQAVAPGVVGRRRHAQRRTMFGVQSPTNPCAPQPVAYAF